VYHLPEGFIPTVTYHGNSKKGIPFHPTWSSTKLKIKDECIQHNPKSIVHSVSLTFGGVINATAPGQLPRDEKQVSNFKNKEKRIANSNDAAADNLFIVMQQAYTRTLLISLLEL